MSAYLIVTVFQREDTTYLLHDFVHGEPPLLDDVGNHAIQLMIRADSSWVYSPTVYDTDMILCTSIWELSHDVGTMITTHGRTPSELQTSGRFIRNVPVATLRPFWHSPQETL